MKEPSKQWFIKGLMTGIRTEKFPKTEPDKESVPAWSTKIEGSGKVACPTNAIEKDKWVAGRCINCRLCAPKYAPTGEARIAEYREGIAKVEPGMFKRSFYIYSVDSGTCGGCNLELQALSTPHYDLNRLGIFFTNTPRHADALVVMGVHTDRMDEVLANAYEAMPEPKLIIALGACAISGGIIGRNPKISKKAVVTIPGCPPNPYTILDGLIKAKSGGQP